MKLVKILAVTGITGTAIAIPLSLPKLFNRNAKSEIKFEIDSEQFKQIQGIQSDTNQQAKKYLPENCKLIDKHSHSSIKIKELILCAFGYSSSPFFYFYEAESPKDETSSIKVTAKKVKTISRKKEANFDLLITLEDGSKQELSPTFSSKWANIEDLIPEVDCEIITSPDKKQKLSCKHGTMDISLE